MDRLHKSVYLLMAFMLLSAPVLACTLPGLAMSDEEKECCRHMADQCAGGSPMDESHSCCTKAPTLGAGTLQPTVKYSTVSPELANDISLATVQACSTVVHPLAGSIINYCSESPPGHISVLRI